MPVAVDPITRRKLILVKQLYRQALVQSASQHRAISRIMAVLGFDLAIETVLNATVRALDSSRVPSDTFQGMIQQADSLLTGSGHNPVPDKANTQHVHSIRNDAQHQARYPNESEVSDCRTYTRDFLQKLILDVWGLSFEGISLTDIIQHEDVKQYLVDAETALSQDDYQQAVKQAAAGLTWALDRVHMAFVGRAASPFHTAFVMSDSFGRSQKVDSDAYRAFQMMQRSVLYLALGMNHTDFMRYRRVAGHVQFYIGGNVSHHDMKEPLDANDAEFVVTYCTDTVVQIESSVGSLDAPFGSDRWY